MTRLNTSAVQVVRIILSDVTNHPVGELHLSANLLHATVALSGRLIGCTGGVVSCQQQRDSIQLDIPGSKKYICASDGTRVICLNGSMP